MTAIAPGHQYRDAHTPDRDRQQAQDARSCSQCGVTLRASSKAGICGDCRAGRKADDNPTLNVPVVPDQLRALFRSEIDRPHTATTARVPPVESHVCPQCHGTTRVAGPASSPQRARIVADHADSCPFYWLSHRMRVLTDALGRP